MAVFESQVVTGSAEFQENRAGMVALVERMRGLEGRTQAASERATS